MSRSIPLQPVVTTATLYKATKPTRAERKSVALQPKVRLAGNQTIAPPAS